MRDSGSELTECRKLFHLGKLFADAFLFGDVVREFLDVFFRLRSLRGGSFDVPEVCSIGEKYKPDNRKRHDKRVRSDPIDQRRDQGSSNRTREVCDRRPKKMLVPRLPDRLVR